MRILAYWQGVIRRRYYRTWLFRRYWEKRRKEERLADWLHREERASDRERRRQYARYRVWRD